MILLMDKDKDIKPVTTDATKSKLKCGTLGIECLIK